MPRATSVRTKKASASDNGIHIEPSVTMIKAPLSLEDEIRIRAYLLYEKEGRQQGRDQEYWLRAESEVLERRGERRD